SPRAGDGESRQAEDGPDGGAGQDIVRVVVAGEHPGAPGEHRQEHRRPREPGRGGSEPHRQRERDHRVVAGEGPVVRRRARRHDVVEMAGPHLGEQVLEQQVQPVRQGRGEPPGHESDEAAPARGRRRCPAEYREDTGCEVEGHEGQPRHPIRVWTGARSYSRTRHPGAVTLSPSSAAAAEVTTLAILPGTTMSLLGSAPARFSWTFASARATASTSAGEASAGTVT